MRKRAGTLPNRSSKSGRRKAGASSADVLGPPAAKPKIPVKWREYYHRLLLLRDELARHQAHLNDDALSEQPTFSSHMADAGTDTFDRDFALGILSTEQEARYE